MNSEGRAVCLEYSPFEDDAELIELINRILNLKAPTTNIWANNEVKE